MASGDDDTLVASLTTSETSAAIPALVAGRYRIVRWLGGGGMGRVYAVLDTELDEHVALKMLRGGLTSEALERFRREVRLTRKIQHRNVARMFDIGETDGDRFLTMELVEGEALSASLGAPMAWSRLQPLAVQICAGLAAAHDLGVTHRDLKPDNVLVERDTDRAVITDFGIARSTDDVKGNVTQTGMIVGTPRYMAPEQLAGTATDARSDLFSLGVMLYELASGARPWAGDNAIAIAVAQATQPMRPFAGRGVPAAFGTIIEELLAIDHARRPASASAIGARIAAITGAVGEASSPTGELIAQRTATIPPSSGHLASPPTEDESSIAVLPFSSGTGDEYLADGMREDLIDMLSTTPALRVRPAGVVDARVLDPRAAGHELGVDHVVVGSLRRTQGGLRVAARLVGVADGFQIWAHRIDCGEADVLAIGDQLGRAIAEALSTRAGKRHALPTDPRAVDLFLRARAELRRFWGEHALTASQLLEEAAAIAPTSAPIAGLLACSTAVAWSKLDRPELLAKSRVYIERALALDHHEGHLASSIIHWNHGDIELSARDLRVALERAPMSSIVHECAGRLEMEIDHGPAGYQHLLTALELDPTRASVVGADLARCEVFSGNWERAWARARALTADPDPAVQQFGGLVLLRLAVWSGDLETVKLGLESAQERRLTAGGGGLAKLARAAISGGTFDRAMWDQTLAEVAAPGRPKRMQVSILQRTIELAVVIGRLDEAIDALRIAASYGLADIVWCDRCPLFATVTDPRWHVLRDEIAARAARALAVFRPPKVQSLTKLGSGADAGRR